MAWRDNRDSTLTSNPGLGNNLLRGALQGVSRAGKQTLEVLLQDRSLKAKELVGHILDSRSSHDLPS